jgi:hypothetical protein
MSIHNTKKPLYHIWHNNAEDSPLGMMMRNEEEGAHITMGLDTNLFELMNPGLQDLAEV